MKTAIVIPARYASQRFDGKPLALISGASGRKKTLVQRSWEAAKKVENIAHLVVATDDARIESHVKSFGAAVVMTSDTPKNGTERCAEMLDHLEQDFDLIVNFQGDAPLTPPDFVTNIVAAMARNAPDMATPVLRVNNEMLAQFRQDRKSGQVGGTTAVFDNNNRALYFSKEVIPYSDFLKTPPLPVFHHVGLYAYRPSALRKYMQWSQGILENIEGLEQLRFLENGAHIECVEVTANGRIFWEVNNPHDIGRVEHALAKMGVE